MNTSISVSLSGAKMAKNDTLATQTLGVQT